jgi:signal peptidase II
MQTKDRSALPWLWVSVLVFLVDRLSKYFAQAFLSEYYTSFPVLPSFNLTLAYNKGAAFSFLAQESGWQAWFFGGLAVVVSGVMVVWLKRLSYQQRGLAIGIAFIIGGALGNLFDRVWYGHVIDFIDLYISYWHWPVFNLADSAICIGAGIVLWDAVKTRTK